MDIRKLALAAVLPLGLAACPNTSTPGGVTIDGQVTPEECVFYQNQIEVYEGLRGVDGTLPQGTAERLAYAKFFVSFYCAPVTPAAP